MTLSTWFKKNSLPSLFDDDFSFRDSNIFSPKADVVEREKDYLIHLELPGVKKENLDLSLKDNVLTVRGEKKMESKKEEEHYYSFESSYGRFERSWVIKDVDEEAIEADMKDGVLKVRLPKKEEVIKKSETKKISVK